MKDSDVTRRSHWILRSMEWDDDKARYPNIWHSGMPRHILAAERLAGRVRLGDLVAIYYPASRKHSERSERYLGFCRVVGLRQAEGKELAWLDLETAFRFQKPPKLAAAPRRVFLCCDPGWPGADIELFRKIYDAAVAEGWQPGPDESIPSDDPKAVPAVEAAREAMPESHSPSRGFAGAHYSGNMRDPRERTWLALVLTKGGRLEVKYLVATGRSGLEARLRDPSQALMEAEAIGLGFPFGVPLAFHEKLVGEGSAGGDWWSLVKRVERLTRPEFLSAAHEFVEAQGEAKRYTDEVAGTDSSLHRDHRDLPPMTYHGIRMIGGDRSRYAVRPFENAQARLLLEVSPDGALGRLGIANLASAAVVERLAKLAHLPVDLSPEFRKACVDSEGALRAVVAARSAASAVLSGESEKSPEQLAPAEADRVRREGWIYGL